jgi:diguanylate cyclase (GGDEF)-like protein
VALLWFSPGSQLVALDPSRAMDQHTLHQWSLEEGLPQATVTDIVQTPEGYLYLATFGGVVRFDGVTMQVLREADGCGSRFASLAVTASGTIWAAGGPSGLCRVDGETLVRPRVAELAEVERAEQLLVDREDNLWVGGLNRLFRFDGQRVTAFTVDAGTTGNRIFALAEDAAGNVWVGADSGLCVIEGATCAARSLGEAYADLQVTALHVATDGRLWIGLERRLVVLGADGPDEIDMPPDAGTIRAILDDGDGNVWIGGQAGGLFRYTGSIDGPAERSPLGASGAGTLMVDREQNLWIGYTASGVKKLSEGRAWGLRVPTIPGSQAFTSLALDSAGDLWAGLPCHGLAHRSGDRFEWIGSEQGLENTCVWSVLPDQSGGVWIGTYGGGLVYRDPTGSIARVEAVQTRENIIWALYQDGPRTLLVGSDSGVFRHTIGSDRWRLVAESEGLNVNYISRDHGGELWLGTPSGIVRLRDGESVRIGREEGLSNEQVRVILHDPDGVAWAGTYGGGLNRIEQGRITVFDQSNGLPDDIVSTLFEDRFGRFWMSGNRGVVRVDRAQLEAYQRGEIERVEAALFDRSDGMPISETNGGMQPAGVMSEAGRLWLPTINGIAVFDTQRDVINPLPPPVLIERVRVDGEVVDHRAGIELPSGTRRLAIEYTGLSLRAPDKVRFRYRLEGFDENWVDAGSRRETYFAAVPSGNYRFSVIAANDDGVWNTTGDSVAINVRPGLLQSPWFYVGLLGLAALVGVVSARLRTKLMQRRQRELEREVGRRTAELAKLAELTEHINRAVKLEQVLDHTYETLHEVMPYDRMILALVDDERSAIESLWSRHGSQRDGQARSYRARFGPGALSRLLASGQPRIIGDLDRYLDDHPSARSTRRVLSEGIQSSIICPLSVSGRAEGFLLLASEQRGAYDDLHVDFLRQLGSQLALAVSKSRLYGELLEAKSDLEAGNRRLASLAARDELTQVPNRRTFFERLEEVWRHSADQSRVLSILMIDVDHFKAFNDALGHQAGDACLRRIAAAVYREVDGPYAMMARVGGEEFSVMLPGVPAADALQEARRLCRTVFELGIEHPRAGEIGRVTISVGCASQVPEPGQRPDGLIDRADRALYRAKQDGRNRARAAASSELDSVTEKGV